MNNTRQRSTDPPDTIGERTERWLSMPIQAVVDFTGWFVENEHHQAWFRWLEWVTVSALVFAVGMKTGSIVVLLVAAFSFLLVWLAGWYGAWRFAATHLPSVSKWNRVVFWLLVLLAGVVPLIVGSFISEVFAGLLSQRVQP